MTPTQGALKEALLKELAVIAGREPGLYPWHNLVGWADACGIVRVEGGVGAGTGAQTVEVTVLLRTPRGGPGAQAAASLETVETEGSQACVVLGIDLGAGEAVSAVMESEEALAWRALRERRA